MILTNTKERTRFLRFAVVGIIGAVVDFGIFNLLTSVLYFKPVYSSIISFLMAVLSNFLWNRYWTYPDSRSKKVSHQMLQFVVVNIIGLGIRTPMFIWLEPRLINYFDHVSFSLPFQPTFLGHNFSLATAVIVVMLWNFFANRYWTYADIE